MESTFYNIIGYSRNFNLKNKNYVITINFNTYKITFEKKKKKNV